MAAMRLHCVVGKRNAGRSRFITDFIGTGANALVIVETDHDFEHHRRRSPEATVIFTHEVADHMPEMHAKSCIALDNVVFDPKDPLLDAILAAAPAPQLLLCVSHPATIPDWHDGPVTFLSLYPRHFLNTANVTNAFQLAAKDPLVGNTSSGSGPL